MIQQTVTSQEPVEMKMLMKLPKSLDTDQNSTQRRLQLTLNMAKWPLCDQYQFSGPQGGLVSCPWKFRCKLNLI